MTLEPLLDPSALSCRCLLEYIIGTQSVPDEPSSREEGGGEEAGEEGSEQGSKQGG